MRRDEGLVSSVSGHEALKPVAPTLEGELQSVAEPAAGVPERP